MASLKIAEGTKEIPQECFRDCTALESVYLPDSIEKIISGSYYNNGAFYNCPLLKDVSIGKNIETIDSFAFRTESEGLEITFREGVTAIPANAFKGRTELTKVVLPDTVKTIGDNAFYSCSKLSSCNFPSSLEKIGSEAFYNTALTSLTLPGCELSYRSFANCTAAKTLKINEGTPTIPQECFRDCTALESVYLPDSIEKIESGKYYNNGAFHNCPLLKIVSIGQNIESIDSYAFRTEGKELEIIFREGVTAVPANAFNGRTELTTLVLPESLESIGQNALKDCTSLTLICIQSTDCEIPDYETAIPSGARIRGYENSTTQSYAENYGRNFETFNEDDPVIAYGNQITGVSLTLDGKIGVNFFAKLNSKAARVILSGPDGKVEYSGDKLLAAKQSDGVYCFTFRVNAIQADKQISLKILDANGRMLDIYNSSFEKDSNKTIEYSVNDYIANAPQYNNDEKLKAMITALDNYCKAAENYFIKGNHTLNIPDADVVKTNDFKKKFEISLVLNSGTALRIYSNAANAVLVNGANEIPLTATIVNKDTKYYEIPEITAFNLLNDVTVKLDGTTYKICPTDYCALILGKSNDKKLRDVCNALYYYGAAAQEYGQSIQQ